MDDARQLETNVLDAIDLFEDLPRSPAPSGPDHLLAEWAAELEHRIELLEEDISLLFKAAGLAGKREQELLKKLGLPDDTLQRHNGELLAQIAGPSQE
jgi:hypothetical protein